MWPFRRREPTPDLTDVLAAVNAYQDETKRALKEIRLEWDDMFDRFRRLYAKISKRAKDAEPDTIEGPPVTEGRDGGDRVGNGQPGRKVTTLGVRMPLGRMG